MKARARWPLWTFLALIGMVAAGIGWDYAVQKNFGTVVPGKIYRSGQPGEAQLEEWIEEYGLESILTMRFGVPPYERELAEEHGIQLYHVPFSANSGPGRGHWKEIWKILTDEENLPLLVHCHGGGDRTGIVTARYRIEVQGWSLEEALREMNRHYHLSLRYPALHEQLRERFEGAPGTGTAQAAR